MSRCWMAMVGMTAMMAAGVAARQGDQARPAAQAPPGGWTIPSDAADRKSPLTVDDKVLAAGKNVYKQKCQKCHGPEGRGDGPDADPDAQQDMDLTVARRATRNPDGVVFYKVSNGRKKPKMPVFKDELTEQQIWTVVAYVQTLRKK